MTKARSRRPYLVRAIYDWSTDNGLTPHLLVAADFPGVHVPKSYVQEGRITLNLSPTAVANLNLMPDRVWFSARFGGRAIEVEVPYGAVLAIFARENGEGVVFGEVEQPDPVDPGPTPEPSSPTTGAKPDAAGKAKRAHLRLVK